ncbi:MAG: hypothetical protein AAFX80_14160 [Cyanobacteria bacterium J06639_18]
MEEAQGVITMICQDKYERPLNNEELYRYYARSEGVWSSDLAIVTVKFIAQEDILPIAKHYNLAHIDFGVQATWKYYHKKNKDINFDHKNFDNKNFENQNSKIQSFEYLMNCCTDSEQPGLMFCQFGSNVTKQNLRDDNRGRILKEVIPDMKSLVLSNSFIVLDYIFVDSHTLITSSGKYKATTCLESENKRYREETYDGRVFRRVWEEKL